MKDHVAKLGKLHKSHNFPIFAISLRRAANVAA